MSKNKTVLIAGGSGLVGRRLSKMLTALGYSVSWLSRNKNNSAPYQTYQWDLEKGFIEEEAIQNAHYVLNLSGTSIASKRWTEKRKAEIISSRTQSIRLLNTYFKKVKFPDAYISATAIGYYGNTGDKLVTEETAAGTQGFLPESCIKWEEAFLEIKNPSVRTAALRVGIVLSDKGGALEKIAMPFKFFMGNWLGSGKQWFSWIHIDDLCRMFIHAIENENVNGFYNAVAPNPVTNKDLTLTLKKVIGKPALMMPVPEFALRLGMGEMADMVLDGSKISSKKIESAGFEFLFPELEGALRSWKRII
jgi:uncharacterized protein (TIGR01777 family)